MAKEGKSRKSLLIGVIAAVVILAGLLALVLTQCVGGQGEATNPTTTAATEPSDEFALYWNVDRHNFEIVDDSLDTTGRKPADDGYYHMVFAKDGELIELKVKERKIVRQIDGQDLMGLVFDSEGIVIDIIRIDDMPYEKVAWQFYVQSIGGKTVKFNSAKEMTGMEVVVKLNDETKIYDMSGCSEYIGAPTELQKDDRCMVVANEDGDVLYVYVYEREGVYYYETRWCEHCQEEIEWSSWPSSKAMPTKPGHWFLTKDINMNEVALLEAEGSYCVDLAGYTVNGPSADGVRYGSYRVYDMYNTNNTKILAIMDTSEGKTGKVVSSAKQKDVGGIIWLRGVNGDECHIYGGTWDVTASKLGAAGVGGLFARTNRGTLYIHDGVFDARGSKTGYGNLIDVSSGYVVINGGTFYGGEAFNFGGGVAVVQRGKMTVNGGTFYGGQATKKGSGQGGTFGLSEVKAELIINGGVIYGGTAIYGGALGIKSGSVTMNGGTIIGGTATGSGGGGVIVHAYGNATATFTMTGGTITGGKQTDPANGGGNVLVWNKNATFNMYGGTITKGYSEGSKGGGVQVKAGAHFTLSGSSKIYGNTDKKGEPSNLLVDTKADFKIVNMRSGANVGILAGGAFGSANKVDYSGYFTADDGGTVIWINDANDPDNGKLKIGKFGCICGANEEGKHIGTCDGTVHEWTSWAGTNLPNLPGYWYMPKDGTFSEYGLKYLEGEEIVTKDIYIDLNGRDITIRDNSRVFRFLNYHNGQINVTFCDSSKDKTAKITTTYGKGPATGLLFYLPNAKKGPDNTNTVTIYGGTWDGSSVVTEKFGGLFEGSGGTINIYGGTFIGATAQDSGGGVACLQGGMKMNMYGGTIMGGKSTFAQVKDRKGGGNIVLWGPRSELNMYGGTITGGVVTNGCGGGVLIRQGKLFVSGDAKITGNTDAQGNPNNVYLDGTSAKIEIGELTEGAKIGVKMSSGVGTFTTAENATDANAKYFVADEAKYTAVATAGGLMLTESKFPVLTHCVCGLDENGKHFGGCVGTELQWLGWSSNNALPTASGNYYLTEDVNMSIVALPSGENININLDLNGFNVNGPSADKVEHDNYRIYDFAYAKKSTVTITDTSKDNSSVVKVAPKVLSQGQMFWVRTYYSDRNSTTKTDNVLNIYGGTYDATAFNGEKYDGIFTKVQNGGTFNMYGGTADVSTVTTTYGAGVSVVCGAFNMTGGQILAGTATQTGGAGVYIEGGSSMSMSGGVITGGKGLNGGNIYANGASELEITGGQIAGGAITTDGGNGSNIYWSGKGTITLDNATITGGSGGTGVYVSNKDVELNISGDTKINGNANGKNASNLYLDEEVSITLPKALGDNALIGVSMADYKESYLAQGAGATDETVAKFVSDDDTYEVVKMPNGLILNVKGETPIAPEDRLPDPLNPAKHCICGMTIEEEHFGDCDKVEYDWTEWTSTNTLPVEAGYYYLSADVTLTETQNVVLNDQAIYIDLNGKTVTGANAVIYSIYKNAEGTENVSGNSITITDSTWKDEGKIVTGNPATVFNGNSAAAFCFAAANNTLNLYAGTIDASKVDVVGAKGQMVFGGVIDTYGAFNMYGGEILGGKLTSGDNGKSCGGVSVCVRAGGLFTMDGGIIEGGTVNGLNRVYHGSLIWVGGEMVMNGGTIADGRAEQGVGGNILVGGSAKFTMNGGTIKNGYAKYDGGNIYGFDNSVVTINGGEIVGGQAERSGGNICMKTDSEKDVEKNIDKWSTLNLNGGVISGGTANSTGGGIYVQVGYVNISGNPVVADNTGSNFCYTNGNNTVAISGEGMTEGASVGITLTDTTKAFITGEKATGANANGFFSDNEAYQVVCLKDQGIMLKDASVRYACDCGALPGEAHMGSCDGYDKDGWTAWDVAANGGKLPAESGKYYIVSDATLTGNVTLAKDVNVVVDFNGKMLTINNTDKNKVRMYDTKTGSPAGITLMDSVGGGGVTANGSIAGHGGLLAIGSGSVVNIYDGTYSAKDNVNAYGAGIYMKGTLNIYGGTIIGGTATKTGGGTICMEGGEFNMYGGTVTGGKFVKGDDVYGGGNVAFLSGAVAHLYGGTISDGTSDVSGGNITIVHNNTKVYIEGTTITGGIATEHGGNIRLHTGSVYHSAGTVSNGTGTYGGNVWLESQENCYYTLSDTGVITAGRSRTGGGNVAMYSKNTFTMTGGTISDGISTGNGWGANVHVNSTDVVFNMSGGTISGGSASGGSVYCRGEATINLSGSAVVDASAITNVGNGAAINMVKGTLNINGATIIGGTAKVNGGALYIKSPASVNMTGGIIKNGTAGEKGGNVYLGNAAMTMTGGTITGGHINVSTASGGGVCVDESATLTVSGEVIIHGNTAKANGHGETKSDVCFTTTTNYLRIAAPGLTGNAMIGMRGKAAGIAYTNSGAHITADVLNHLDYFSPRYVLYFNTDTGSVYLK